MSALSHSRMYLYDKCRMAYKYKYIDRIKPQPGDMHLDSWTRMQRGILIHAGMEAGFTGKDMASFVLAESQNTRGNVLTAAQQAAMPELIRESIEVAKAALDWLPVTEWEPVIHHGEQMVEFELRAPLPGWTDGFLGYADLVARHKPSGAIYLIDYKARGTFEGEDSDRFNSQFAIYLNALATLGIDVAGTILFEIKPTVPKRASRVSRDDSGTIHSVRDSIDGRFRLTPTFRGKRFVENFWRDFQVHAQAIANETRFYRSMSAYTCKYCEFARVCHGDLAGHDTANILQSAFTSEISLADEGVAK